MLRVLVAGVCGTDLHLLAGSGANQLTIAAPTQAKLDLARVRGADRTVLVDRYNPAASF